MSACPHSMPFWVGELSPASANEEKNKVMAIMVKVYFFIAKKLSNLVKRQQIEFTELSICQDNRLSCSVDGLKKIVPCLDHVYLTCMSIERQVAIFPLPDVAVLPGEIISLQIFEPRYRQMVEAVESRDLLMGISLAGKVLHSPEPGLDFDPLLRNQKLYEPNTIFGCGPIIIKDRLPDGRFMIDLHVQHKTEIVEFTQTLPFYLAKVAKIEDVTDPLDSQKNLAKKLRSELVSMTKTLDPTISATIARELDGVELNEAVVAILSMARFSGVFKQQLLEKGNWSQRAEVLIDKLPELFPRTTH